MRRNNNNDTNISQLVYEAERAIVQRRFQEALSVSTRVLRWSIDHHPGQRQQQCSDFVWSPDDKVRFFVFDKEEDDDGYLLDDKFINYVGINASGTELSYLDRATAVALQSCYEIGMMVDKSSNSSCTDTIIQKEPSHTIHNGIISLIINVYRWNGTTQDQQSAKLQKTMPLELVIMLLQFCNTIATIAEEYHIVEISAVGCADILHAFFLFHRRYDEEFLSSEKYYSSYNDICILFLTKIIPYLDPETVQWLIERRLTVNNNNNNKKVKRDDDNYVRRLIWSKNHDPHAQSIKLAIDFISQTIIQMEECSSLLKCLEYCLDELYSLLLLHEDDKHSSPLASNTEMISNDTKNSRDQQQQQQQQQQQPIGMITRLLIPSHYYMNTYIVEPLWFSERRWENRLSVASFALAAFTCWKKRKHVRQVASVAATAVTSPLREIVDAIFTTND